MSGPTKGPKRYFVVSSMDIHPSAVRVGSIIHNLNRPDKPLSMYTPVVLTDAERVKRASDGNSTKENTNELVADTPLTVTSSKSAGSFTRSGDWGVGIFATFLQQLVQAAKLAVAKAKTSQFLFSAEKITTSRFAPSASFVRAAVADPEVARTLLDPHERVYLIVAVKVARHLKIVQAEGNKGGVDSALGFDIPAAESTVGVKGHYKGSTSSVLADEYPGPVVFAFEVEQVRVTKKGEVQRLDSDKVKGTMLGHAKEQGRAEIVVENEVDGEILELFDLGVVASIDDDGEACELFVETEVGGE